MIGCRAELSLANKRLEEGVNPGSTCIGHTAD